jgi:hypothetical protein
VSESDVGLRAILNDADGSKVAFSLCSSYNAIDSLECGVGKHDLVSCEGSGLGYTIAPVRDKIRAATC